MRLYIIEQMYFSLLLKQQKLAFYDLKTTLCTQNLLTVQEPTVY